MSQYDKWLPTIDEELCTLCGVCVEACGPKCLDLGDVAVLSLPHACGSEEHCIAPCPEKAIRMVWLPLEGDHSVGKWRVADESGGARAR
jgi:MinD superfamily P-loop ATPase